MNSWVARGNARNTLHDTRSDDLEVEKKMEEVDTKLQKIKTRETGDI